MGAIDVIIGGLITIATAMLVEYVRRPSLRLAIEQPPLDRTPAYGRCRNLRLRLINKSLPWGLQWIQRSAALQCRGEITFHHLDDGQDVFGRIMPVRWARSPEPIASQILDTNSTLQFYIVDFARGTTESRMDVYPGEEEMLDVAVRFDGEAECYGWNNEVYGNNWRTPRWRLPGGQRYLVKVVVISSGQKCIDVFRLINDTPQLTDFRLLEASKEDSAKLS